MTMGKVASHQAVKRLQEETTTMKNPLRVLCGLLLALSVTGATCNDSIVRDAKVYKAEEGLKEQFALRLAGHVEHFISTSCTCTEGKLTDPKCKQAAKDALTAKVRAPYHKALSLHNAGLGERPSKEPPAVPSPDTLCSTATVSE